MTGNETRLKRLEELANAAQLLEGEPVPGENILEWLKELIKFYVNQGFINENGEVVKDRLNSVPEGVRERIEMAGGVLGKLLVIRKAEP